jgi:hypothetical protein
MKTLPVCAQTLIYDNGGYHRVSSELVYSSQIAHNASQSTGIDAGFMDAYNVLTSMSSITKVTEGNTNTFQMMSNDTTHMFTLLQAGDYTPALQVDNTRYDAENADRFTLDGKKLKVESAFQMAHYHVNMASMLRLGEWFDYLRENEVYDNTRIILVSDHGRDLAVFDTDYTDPLYDIEYYQSLLLVKDFYAEGFTTSEDFMTNADVPTLAVEGLIEEPVNPFTGNAISSDYKTENNKQYVIMSEEWNISKNGTDFYKVKS